MLRKVMVWSVLVVFVAVTTNAFAGAKSAGAPEEVFVTQNGSKYHKEICRLIKGKKDVNRMDKKEAMEGGYTPCRKCFSEDLAVSHDETDKGAMQSSTKK